MKTKPVKDFEQFKKWFTHYQNRFGLTGYQVYFKYEPLQDAFASIDITQGIMVASVTLNSGDKANPEKHIKESAKHEAVHLLIHRLEYIGRCRYTQPDEINEATEELVVKISKLISD